MTDVLLFVLRLGLAAVLGISAIAKLPDRAGVAAAAQRLGVPGRWSASVARGLPLTELGLAFALLVPLAAFAASIVAACLFLALSVVVAINVSRGRAVACHCFGPSITVISWWTVARNALLTALAVAAAALHAQAGTVATWAWLRSASDTARVALVLDAVLLVASVLLVTLVVQVVRQHGRMLLRLAALEGDPVSRTRVSLAQPLPVGAPLPDLAVPDLHGTPLRLRDLRARRGHTLLTFVDPQCGPCSALLPHLETWSRALAIVLVSRGDPTSNAHYAALDGLVVLLQLEIEVSLPFGALATPSALLIDDEGRIASPVATGVDAIVGMVAHGVPAGANVLQVIAPRA